MGVASLFCCFRNQKPNCLAITGLVANVVGIIFLIWGIAENIWFRKGVEVMYDLAFTLLCLTLVGFIVIIIFLNINGASRMIYNIGKIICLAIIGACALAFIFYLVDFIILCKDYADFSVSGRYWAAAIIPSLLAFAAIIVMALIANRLVKEFSDRMNSAPAYPNAVPQTTMTTNIPQPSLFPNNNGPNPPVVNDQSRAVVVQQGGNNA